MPWVNGYTRRNPHTNELEWVPAHFASSPIKRNIPKPETFTQTRDRLLKQPINRQRSLF